MAYFLPPKKDIPGSRHEAVAAWFLGPRAENFSYLEKVFKYILEKQKNARETLYPDDKPFISPDMQNSDLFKAQTDRLESELTSITRELSAHSVPFWSPRYNGHMSMDTSMPSIIGYLTGLLFNQNNVATEASPLTTAIEMNVGKDLCDMFGYDTNAQNPAHGWGHITCGGSVANLESIWAARNLKFYPFSLALAISEGPLDFLGESGSGAFHIELCTGESKPFMLCSTWELLNLRPSTVLDIPNKLATIYGISQTALAAAMKPYLIQTVGKDYLERYFAIHKPPQLFVGTTKHYSWPKGAAIAGIGSAQVIDVPVDLQARMDTERLRGMLEHAIANEQAIYAVVAIIGSTEHGAVDPLTEILQLRGEFESKGLSFVIHCDGAWGGYFATMIRESSKKMPKGFSTYVPTQALSEYTAQQLDAYRHADSITIDPHKSGYCPYPAGALCYRDGRMRYLVTWTSPVIFREGENKKAESIGVYGVEGSKPGAAAVGVYLSHRVLGLHKDGYGTLLGEAVFSCSRLYCHWAAMKTEPVKCDNGATGRLIVRPLNMMPTEKAGASPEEIEEQRQFIRDRILHKDNAELVRDKDAMDLLQQLGGDLMINAFACNFEIDGKINEDVVEANYLNARIFQRLSVSDPQKTISTVPLLLTSTTLAQSAYKDCLTCFKKRLGLEGDQDLYVLINVTMSPWPTTGNFLAVLADEFKIAAEEEMRAAVRRNYEFPHLHGFIMQGVDQICGVHLPMYNDENHRTQLIISCDLPPEIMEEYRRRKAANPKQYFTFGNKNPMKLLDFIKDGASFEATVQEGVPGDNKQISGSAIISNVKILFQQSLHSKDLDGEYPNKMVFCAYGRGSELHMDHLLSSASPNIQLNSERIEIVESTSSRSAADTIIKHGAFLRLKKVNEKAMQPLMMNPGDPHTSFDRPGLPFVPGSIFEFEGFDAEGVKYGGEPIITGRLALGPSVFADALMLNDDSGKKEMGLPVEKAHETGGALATEFPNPGMSEELRNQYQGMMIQGFEDSWIRSKHDEAQKRIEEYKSKENAAAPPAWLQDWIEEGEKAAERKNAAAESVRTYHDGLH